LKREAELEAKAASSKKASLLLPVFPVPWLKLNLPPNLFPKNPKFQSALANLNGKWIQAKSHARLEWGKGVKVLDKRFHDINKVIPVGLRWKGGFSWK